MPKLRVTDHAVLRYLVRAGGFELNKLRAEIEARVTEAYRGQPYVHLPSDGLTFVVRTDEGGPTVTTVLDYPATPQPKRGRK